MWGSGIGIGPSWAAAGLGLVVYSSRVHKMKFSLIITYRCIFIGARFNKRMVAHSQLNYRVDQIMKETLVNDIFYELYLQNSVKTIWIIFYIIKWLDLKWAWNWGHWTRNRNRNWLRIGDYWTQKGLQYSCRTVMTLWNNFWDSGKIVLRPANFSL